jgi:hypothetical protein
MWIFLTFIRGPIRCSEIEVMHLLTFRFHYAHVSVTLAWHLRFVINWGLFEHRFQAILNNLRKHRNNLDQEAAALHYQQMKELRERSEREIADYEDRRQLLMVRDILEWLSADEDAQEEISHRLENACHPGTCDWIFSKPSFLSWMSPQNRVALLWLEGKPGSGKSKRSLHKTCAYGHRKKLCMFTDCKVSSRER